MNSALYEQFEEHRPGLISIAYRMLGSVVEAEDIVQEALSRFVEASPSDVKSPKAYLAMIVTRLSINHLKSAKVRREQYKGTWLPEPVETSKQSDPVLSTEQRDSIRMAFMVMLERLTPVERAVFLLRDVFGYQYREISEIVATSEANCRQILHRARSHISENRRRFQVSKGDQARLLNRFIEVANGGRIEELVGLLAADAKILADGGGRTVAVLVPVVGRTQVARLLIGAQKHLLPENLVRSHAEINGQPGIVNFHEGEPFSVFTVDFDADGLANTIYIVTNPAKLHGFVK